MNKTISVIVPAYNIEEYLPRCLDSILAQTYENLEIIVVNDGSKDDTGSVADAYAAKDSRIRVVHKENGGVTSARLRGVAEAKGEYIGFIDGDDFIEPQMYRRLLENLKHYDAEISHCGYQMVFPSRVDYYHNTGRLLVQKGEKGCSDLLSGEYIEPGLCNKLYKKELFDGLDDWIDKSIRIYEDLLMNFYLFRQVQTAVFEDVCSYHYVLREGSACTTQLNEYQLKDPLKVRRLLLKETENDKEWHKIVENNFTYYLIYTATIALGEQKEMITPVRREARRELRQRLWYTLTSKTFGTKLKIMALWAAVWPWSYSIAHKIYARIRGTDKKFEVK